MSQAVSAALATSNRTGTGNVIRLAIAQALAGANSTVLYATGAIVGSTLAPTLSLKIPFIYTNANQLQ